MRFGVEGYFRLRVFKADGTFTGKDTGWMHNLITDQGLDALAQQADVMTHFHVGTSSAAPAFTDTWLGAHQATTTTLVSDTNGIVGTSYGWRRVTRRFAVGQATGNMSECAVGWSATTGTAFMHELTRDGGGSPISITVLADEYLELTYELRYNIPAGDFTGSGNIDAVAYNYTARAASCSSTYWWSSRIGNQITVDLLSNTHYAYTGNIGAITTVPSGQSGTATVSITVDTYNPGDLHRDFTISADTTQWNVAGGIIRSLTFGCTANRMQAQFAKVSDATGIPKSGAGTLTMGYKVSWARA